jgi:hypothetical protein
MLQDQGIYAAACPFHNPRLLQKLNSNRIVGG